MPECGAWQYKQEAERPPLTGEAPAGDKSCEPITSFWARTGRVAKSKKAHRQMVR